MCGLYKWIKRWMKRGVSEYIAILVVVAIVVVVGVVMALMFSGMLGGGSSRASLMVSGTGTANPDGTGASISLTIQNSGDGAARVTAIFIEAISGALPPSTVIYLGTGVTATIGPPTPPGTMPAVGLDIPGKAMHTVLLRITGTGIYPGVSYRISVIYFDIGSRSSSVVSTIVTLR